MYRFKCWRRRILISFFPPVPSWHKEQALTFFFCWHFWLYIVPIFLFCIHLNHKVNFYHLKGRKLYLKISFRLQSRNIKDILTAAIGIQSALIRIMWISLSRFYILIDRLAVLTTVFVVPTGSLLNVILKSRLKDLLLKKAFPHNFSGMYLCVLKYEVSFGQNPFSCLFWLFTQIHPQRHQMSSPRLSHKYIMFYKQYL